MLGFLLRSPVPMVMLWGEDGVMLYNDAYSAFAGGRHPKLLGSKVREGWPEVSDFNDNVMRVGLAGGTLAFRDQELTLLRHGQPEQVWMNLDYSPVPGDDGQPAGVLCILAETTERVRAEQQRKEADAALRMTTERTEALAAQQAAILSQLAEGVIVTDPAGHITFVNDAAARLHGVARLDVAPSAYSETYHLLTVDGRPYPSHELPLARAVRDGETVSDSRWCIRRPDGSEVLAVGSARPVLNPAGDQIGAVLTLRDDTKREAAERMLRENEARLRALTDNLPSGIVYQISTGRDGTERRFLYVSQSHEALTGIPAEAVLADPTIPYQLILPEDRPAMVEAEAVSIRDRTPFDVQLRFRHSDGEVRWCRIISAPREQLDGSLIWDGIQIDVTHQKRAEEDLRQSEARLEAIANSIDQMVWSTRPDGFHDFYNQRWYDYTGVPPGSTDGEAWNGMFHPDDQERAWTLWKHSLRTGAPYRIEYRLKHRSGHYRWVLGRAQAMRDEAGQITRWYGTCTDIEEIVAAREVLARSREDLEREVARRTAERDQLWTLSEDMFARANYTGMMSAVSPAWTRVLGWSEVELLSRSYASFMHPDDMEPTLAALARMQESGQPTRFENRIAAADGTWTPIEWIVAAEPDGANFIAVGRDVSAAREQQASLEATQEALRQSQKMEAVGQLTGGIAHDFNNMLAVVVGSLDLLGRRIGVADARAMRYVDAAMDGARRAALLTQRLLAFSRQQPLRPEPIDANKLVAGMSVLLRHSLGGDVRLETVLAGGLWRTHADPNQLENVILNLAVNARDAMPEGGRLTIETQNAHLDSRYTAVQLGVVPGQYVLIAVTDTGSGMPPDVMAKAFDPFFTTKDVGRGTGLGLSQVYGFVKQSGGHVKIYSEPGQGTTIKVYLPRHVGELDAGVDEPPADELPLGDKQEVVLVVEPAVRQFSVDALEELGYHVLEADGAAAALRLLDAHPEIALMFTDVVMPEVNGAKLAAEARRRRPDLRILFTTGYTRNAVVHNGVLDPGVEMIGKPFTIEELAAKVREALDRPPSASP